MDRRHQELFNLCYSFVAQKGISQQADIQNGIYGMHRGIIAVWLLSLPLFVVAVLRHSALAVASALGFADTPFDEIRWHLSLAGAAVTTILATLPFLRRRLAHFGRRFVDAVYRGFYVYVTSQASETPGGRPTSASSGGAKMIEAHFINVGCGNMVLLHLPDGKTMLYDCNVTIEQQ